MGARGLRVSPAAVETARRVRGLAAPHDRAVGGSGHSLDVCHFDQQLDADRGWEIDCGRKEVA